MRVRVRVESVVLHGLDAAPAERAALLGRLEARIGEAVTEHVRQQVAPAAWSAEALTALVGAAVARALPAPTGAPSRGGAPWA